MNAPAAEPGRDAIAAARENVYANLSAAQHYIRCALLHLEFPDDAGALYDLQHAREYFARGLRDFAPLRALVELRMERAEAEANA